MQIGAGARYYFDQCGVYAGLLAKYAHTTGNDDFVPEVHVGYAFFLGRHVTLEPEVYFEHSFNDSDYSGPSGCVSDSDTISKIGLMFIIYSISV